MAKSRKPHSPGARRSAGADKADYTIGYGKPPKSCQYIKGQSGNSGGSSKKVRARKEGANGSPFDQILLDEIARPVTISENGKRTKITTSRAIGRSLMIEAAKGSRSAQKIVLERAQAAYDRRQATTTERFGLLVQYVTSQLTGQNGPAAQDAVPWPHAKDVELDFVRCVGHVVGPIDAQQAEPFIALVEEYRIWQARLDQVRQTAGQSNGELKTHFEAPVTTITRLISTIREHLPPSFKMQLDWDDAEIPAGALDMEGLNDGETVNLALLAPDSNEMAYATHLLVSGSIDASEVVRERTKLNITANTTSLINRLQIERQNRDGGALPAPAVPDFGQFYPDFATEGQVSVDEVAP